MLREDKKLARENAIEEATIRQSKDPDRDLIIQQLKDENIPVNKQTYGRQKLSNAKGFVGAPMAAWLPVVGSIHE